MDFREFMKGLMEKRNLKIKDIAEQTGYSLAYIYDLIKGARRFNEESEKRFCECFNIKKIYTEDPA